MNTTWTNLAVNQPPDDGDYLVYGFYRSGFRQWIARWESEEFISSGFDEIFYYRSLPAEGFHAFPEYTPVKRGRYLVRTAQGQCLVTDWDPRLGAFDLKDEQTAIAFLDLPDDPVHAL
ncbi:MAG: hypothetical protein INR69_12630 [Mucilaginibacter polytrichastri]|nr:hypothetical protein [Mucilaginibacter polytrichastri]